MIFGYRAALFVTLTELLLGF